MKTRASANLSALGRFVVSADEPLRVLIVDDDALALSALEHHLASAGYEVIKAADGAAAMLALEADGPPLVITDWQMPEMDGLELCRRIRAHEAIPFAYVIVVSAHTDDHRVVEAFDAGADGYLCKPYKADELLARVRAGERIVKLRDELDRRSREVHRYNAQIEIINRKLASANAELDRMATTDELTKLSNRREAMAKLAVAWNAAERHGHPLTCIAMDIDRFKRCNDAYGHHVGDVVLKETADVLRASARRDEPVYRVGGEEFLVVCPGTHEALASIGAERLRRAVEDNTIQDGEFTLRVTVSLGVAERTRTMSGPDDLLRAADNALYMAKDAGRNCIRLASASDEEPLLGETQRKIHVSPARIPAAENGAAEEPAKVLIVDHDESARALCREILQRDGHTISEAADGQATLERVEMERPGVVIMDVTVPETDGLECICTLKADPNTQVILVVPAGSRSDATCGAAGLEAGADECLTRPYRAEELLTRVRTMVRLKRQSERNKERCVAHSRALSLLSDFSRAIAATRSLEDVLESTLAATAALMRCRCVSILLPDSSGQILSVAGCLGIEPYRTESVRLPIGTMTSGHVLRSRQSVVVSTVGETRCHSDDPDALLLSSVPSISTPLCTLDGAVGVLNLTGRQGGQPLEPVEFQYLDLVCNLAGSAIHDWHTRDAHSRAPEVARDLSRPTCPA